MHEDPLRSVNGTRGARQPEAHNAASQNTALTSADLPHDAKSSPTIDDSVAKAGYSTERPEPGIT